MDDRKFRSYQLTTVKTVGDLYKIVECRRPFDEPMRGKRVMGEEKRWDNNVSRARTAVKELALCNPWEWFVTLTLDKDKQDRYDLDAYHKRLTHFLNDQNKRRAPESKIAYILIPEKHKDGAWHMHGLIHGLQAADLYRNQYGYWGWKAYERSFGFLSVGRIKSRKAVIGYVCKYICKGLAKEIDTARAHMYYRSRGLKEPDLLFKGDAHYYGTWDFKNADYGLKLVYTDSLDKLDMGVEFDAENNTAQILEALATGNIQEIDLVGDSVGEFLDGYAPLRMAGFD